MGRRSINTTKSGKYMNPTDQARKEARKKELKKNKKQRQMVRAAVLKGKDPTQIILEMEKMDIMEYNVECQPTLSEKVLKDKRKKLKETLDRVMKLYEKENPEYWVEIRRMEADYEKKRQARIEYYEAVRHAQAVTVDEIPLPNLDMPSLPDEANQSAQDGDNMISAAQIPNTNLLPPHSILKKSLTSNIELQKPPGCPPMLPPDLSDDEETMDATDLEAPKEWLENDEESEAIRSRTVRFAEGKETEEDKDTRLTLKKSKNLTSLQAKLLQMSGQDIDDFMRESEVLFNEKAAERQADLRSRLEMLDDGPGNALNLQQPPPVGVLPPRNIPGPPPGVPPSAAAPNAPLGPQSFNQVPPGVGMGAPNEPSIGSSQPQPSVAPSGTPIAPAGVPPPLMLRPPPRGAPPLMPGIRMPIGPPPQGLPPRLPPMNLRPPLRPPGPPLGMMPHNMMLRGMLPPTQNPNVLSAEPQLIARPSQNDKKRSATIEAKPQIRSLSADVTRFLPTALRVKREDKKRPYKQDTKEIPSQKPEETDRKPTKDDAYSQFMQEMEGLL